MSKPMLSSDEMSKWWAVEHRAKEMYSQSPKATDTPWHEAHWKVIQGYRQLAAKSLGITIGTNWYTYPNPRRQ